MSVGVGNLLRLDPPTNSLACIMYHHVHCQRMHQYAATYTHTHPHMQACACRHTHPKNLTVFLLNVKVWLQEASIYGSATCQMVHIRASVPPKGVHPETYVPPSMQAMRHQYDGNHSNSLVSQAPDESTVHKTTCLEHLLPTKHLSCTSCELTTEQCICLQKVIQPTDTGVQSSSKPHLPHSTHRQSTHTISPQRESWFPTIISSRHACSLCAVCLMHAYSTGLNSTQQCRDHTCHTTRWAMVTRQYTRWFCSACEAQHHMPRQGPMA